MHNTVYLVSSLTKVTPAWQPTDGELILSGWEGETVSFQIAWHPHPDGALAPEDGLAVAIDSDAPTRIYAVDLVPVQVPSWETDDGYLATTPGLLPDVLRPVGTSSIIWTPTHSGWNTLWVDVTLPASRLRVRVSAGDDTVLDQELTVQVVGRPLPRHGAEFTQWFHADALASIYGVDMWSDEHWEIIESQMRAAADMGVTMLLTPVWTPPLDTAIGSYRATAQLIDITDTTDGYRFGTDRLDRWMDALSRAGIPHVELPPLFTQWGAHATPRFLVTTSTGPEHRFGWDTAATDPAYARFLADLIGFLRRYLTDRVGPDGFCFHVSDEPSLAHLDSYRAAQQVVAPLLDGVRVIDALSDPAYADLVKEPVVASNHVAGFRDAGIEPGWVYHCVAQSLGVANRFIAQHAVRTRALGWQLYKARATGFLHWGFNFYFAQLAERLIDPFRDTSSGGRFPGGDAFIVYPGPDHETWPSLRHRIVQAAFCDLAAARAAEDLIGRDRVLAIIDPEGDLDYDSGWVSGDEWLRRRRALDRAVSDALN